MLIYFKTSYRVRIKLNQIYYFKVVAEEQNFRRAAKRLYIAQPALSRSIKLLEQELNVSLFKRSKQRVQITEAGKSFLEGCNNIIASIEIAVANARLIDNGQLGVLRIGYTDQAIAGYLPNLISEFQSKQPNITLNLHHGFTHDQLEELEHNKIDVGFVTGPIKIPNINVYPIQQEDFLCVVYQGHELAERKSIRLEELAEENFVHGPSDQWRYFFNQLIPLCLNAGFTPKIVQEANNTDGILRLVAGCMGITILSENMCANLIPGLVSIPLEDVHSTVDTFAIWKTKNLSGAKDRFVEYLKSDEYISL